MYSGLSVTAATARSLGHAFPGQLVDAANHAREHRRDPVLRFGESVGMAFRCAAAHARHILDKTLALPQ